MNYRKIAFLLLLLFAFTLTGAPRDEGANSRISGNNEITGSASARVISQKAEFAPDGNRTSRYPPYHHPDQ